MLEVERKERKVPQSFTLKPSTRRQLEELAAIYKTNASNMVETLITHYGPKLVALEEERQKARRRTAK
jgi:hypothetical protein